MLSISIITAGNIAKFMATALSNMKGEIKCRAVAARDIEKAKEFAKEFNFEKAYGSYQQLVEDDETDIVYIGSPHSHHYEHIKLALNAGKHVICEKTFTVNAVQAKEVIELARSKNLFLMEAVWTRFLPAVIKAKEVVDSGRIGTPKVLVCSFAQTIDHLPRLVDPNLAGGALLDLGIYPLTLASIYFNDAEITDTQSWAYIKNGVDYQSSYNLTYSDGKTAVLHSGIDSESNNVAFIGGDNGYIIIKNCWAPDSFSVYKDRFSEPEVFDMPFEINGFEYQVRAAIKAIEEGKTQTDEMPLDTTLSMIRRMDGMRDAWGLKYPFE